MDRRQGMALRRGKVPDGRPDHSGVSRPNVHGSNRVWVRAANWSSFPNRMCSAVAPTVVCMKSIRELVAVRTAAQTRAGAIAAHGSYLGCVAEGVRWNRM